jgi:hypothetical protein
MNSINQLSDNEIEAVGLVIEELLTIKHTGKEIAHLVSELIEFTIIFRFEDGIFSMVKFILWCKEHNETYLYMVTTIMHDLIGRNDSCFSPRTSSFRTVAN